MTTRAIYKTAITGLLLALLSACTSIPSGSPDMGNYSYTPQTVHTADDITVATPGSLEDF